MRTALQTAAAMRAGETTAAAETDAAIARIEARDGPLNAVVVRDFDRARAAARAFDMDGDTALPLAGVAMTVKEAFDVAGLPTSWGFDHAKDAVATTDALTVRRLKAAGAIIVGKTNVAPGLADWQSDNAVYGRTANPHDPARTAGGSSGGSAATLASGMVPLELGSDIGGSIRIPAHFCGVWGHKPTYGAIDARGHHFPGTEGADPALGVVGPMARDADDLATALDVLADRPLPRAAGLDRPLRVLMLTEHPCAPTAADVRAGVERVGAALARGGARVDTASALLPDLARQHASYRKMLAITLTRGAPSPAGKVATAAHWFDELDHQAHATRAWQRLFGTFDAVIAPPDVVTAFAHQAESYDARTLVIDGVPTAYDAQLAWAGVATYPGLPATCFPAGVDRDGLPTGVQVIAGLFQDHQAIAVARVAHDLVRSNA